MVSLNDELWFDESGEGTVFDRSAIGPLCCWYLCWW